MKSGVYRITNTARGRTYIGSAKCLSERWKRHSRMLNAGRHENAKLQRAWTKYGASAFVFEVVEFAEVARLLAAEQRVLDAERPHYNICRTAGSRLGMRHTAHARAKIGSASRQRWADGRNKSCRGRLSAEGRARIVASRHARPLTAEAIAKGIATRRRNGTLGQKPGWNPSREYRARMSASTRGERNAAARLTEADVVGIKHALRAGESQTSIGARYGVAQAHVSRIAHGKSWAHVTV